MPVTCALSAIPGRCFSQGTSGKRRVTQSLHSPAWRTNFVVADAEGGGRVRGVEHAVERDQRLRIPGAERVDGAGDVGA